METVRTGGGFLSEVIQAFAIVSGFLLGGLSLAGIVLLNSEAGYPGAMPELGEEPEVAPQGAHVWLVDGFNVLQVALLQGRERQHWWGPERRAELILLANRFDLPGAEVCIVFDGPRPAPAPELGSGAQVETVFAPSADEWMVARVKRDLDPSRIAVVTADRRLAGRARRRGAAVVSPRAFLSRCQSAGTDDSEHPSPRAG